MLTKAEMKNRIFTRINNEELLAMSITDDFSLNIQPLNACRYQNPVLGSQCGHQGKPFELMDVAKAFSENKTFKCPHCQKEIKNSSDLRRIDLYFQVYRIFHPKTSMISILSGILMTKYNRSESVLDCLKKEESQQVIQSLFLRKNQENNISTIIKQDKKFQQINKRIISFEVVCLLDNVKIVIPVRHKNCKHISSYDISSLLMLWNQQDKNLNPIPCNEDGCLSLFNLNNSLEDLGNDLVLDKELFNHTNMGYPGVTNFVYERQTQRICDIISFNDNNVDPYIQKSMQINQNNNQIRNRNSLNIQIIFNFRDQFGVPDEQIKNNKQFYKYQTFNLSLKDIDGEFIQYPARCVKCPQFDKFWDLRRLLIYIKQFKDENYNIYDMPCPICNEKIRIRSLESIYFDYDLMIRIHEMKNNANQVDRNTLKYDGKKYMLQEFIQRHKVSIDQYIQNSNNKELIVYKSFFSEGKRLTDPLRLIKCPTQNKISFEFFYQKFAENQYKIEGLCLCKCKECIDKPLKQINDSIYYDELFAYVLSQIPQNTKDQEIQYNILSRKIIYPDKSQQGQPETKTKAGNEGFLDYMNEEQFNNLFKKQYDEKGQFMFEVISKTQNIYGVTTIIDNDGKVTNDSEGRLEQINKDFVDNQWGFEVTAMKVTNGQNVLFEAKKK